ncbi:ATP-binding protein [bacterium]|nr:MAG: ATP-binding protein [bacterium]
MTMIDVYSIFPKGLLHPELFIGVVSSVTANTVGVNLGEAGRPTGSHFSGSRYGRGEVGEFVLIEGQQSLLLGRISEVRLNEGDRRTMRRESVELSAFDVVGGIRLLGAVAMDNLRITAGVDAYPRIGDRIFAAPHPFLGKLPLLMESELGSETVMLNIGSVDEKSTSDIEVKPERLFGRHCAILGSTGGGKSWTTAKVIEECRKHRAKLILIDATGEYRGFTGNDVEHCHLGSPVEQAANSEDCSLPPTGFSESDFVALFEPAGKVQGPKLRAAIRSLRLAQLKPRLATNGLIMKINQSKGDISKSESDPDISAKLEDPGQSFDPKCLAKQIEQECVYPDGYAQARGVKDTSKWGGEDGNFSHCLSLVTRINGILTSPGFSCVFAPGTRPPISQKLDAFVKNDKKLLRICLSGIAFEFNAREIIANVIGRYLLNAARSGAFKNQPLVVFVDEAHNFLGRRIGSEDYASRLDAFEVISREGRKYGLNICLATQRPRDITENVLSQIGTLIVHRLTNDRDREVVERACGEIDRAASSFLPNLKPGEAAIIGTDFPIPLTVKIHEPVNKPKSDGPNYQGCWASTTK